MLNKSFFRQRLIVVLSTALFFSVSTLFAYDIYPGLLAELVKKEALHEQMALASQECAKSEMADDDLSCQWPELEKHITTKLPKLSRADWALTRGVEWPDNPVRSAVNKGALGFAVQMASGCARYKHPTGGLLCKSHYYDLQFMHAMSPIVRQPANKTQKQILEWLQFIYTSLLDPSTLNKTLGEIMKGQKYSEIAPALTSDNSKVKMSSWKGWSLFSYTDTRNSPTRHPDLKNHPFQFLIGVMLHTIQDSYSSSHNKRGDNEQIGPMVTCAPIIEFFTYQGQEDKKHAAADKPPNLDSSCTMKKRIVDDPILAGARLIRMAQNRMEWVKVKLYLETRVFPVSLSYARSSSGPFGKSKLPKHPITLKSDRR